MTRVLVVEDEESFSDALSYMLRKEGFEVAVCPTGPAALDTFDRTGADLVLLDLMLPGLPGSEVCRALRERSNVPVIMLTAKDSEIDKVVGLELGADDYVTKPFSSRELVARMRAVLRRRGDGEEAGTSVMESGPVRMDVERHIVMVRNASVQLRPCLGRRLCRRHKDARRSHQAAPGQGGAGPCQANAHHHGPRTRLQVRAWRIAARRGQEAKRPSRGPSLSSWSGRASQGELLGEGVAEARLPLAALAE